MDENTVREPRLCPAHSLPASALETVARVVCGDDVQEEDVAEGRVQAGQLQPQSREHSSNRKRNTHVALVECINEVDGLGKGSGLSPALLCDYHLCAH